MKSSSGDDAQNAEREIDAEVLQIVRTRAAEFEPSAGLGAA
jgi:hypothetical protein